MSFFNFPAKFIIEISHQHIRIVSRQLSAGSYGALKNEVIKLLFLERLNGNMSDFRCVQIHRDHSRPCGGGRMYESIRYGAWEIRVTQEE